ncbi:unnamed protein product [Pleuronectes platessa]|uniref:Uncharacterized protein n=1 Tax=Pleuronectes platessa TaxID=8262 RepID=A0A9N7YNE6_PLEPL|nr:unnamed protein product [Pleuronectes platessa]
MLQPKPPRVSTLVLADRLKQNPQPLELPGKHSWPRGCGLLTPAADSCAQGATRCLGFHAASLLHWFSRRSLLNHYWVGLTPAVPPGATTGPRLSTLRWPPTCVSIARGTTTGCVWRRVHFQPLFGTFCFLPSFLKSWLDGVTGRAPTPSMLGKDQVHGSSSSSRDVSPPGNSPTSDDTSCSNFI